MRPIHPIALFRLSVLGPLASRERFERGQLKRQIAELAKQRYDIPNSRQVYLSEKTIEAWYYLWLKGGIDALQPKPRCDRGKSKLSADIQQAIIDSKEQNPKRSIDTIKTMLEEQGVVQPRSLSRASIHRLLKQKGLSAPTQAQASIERRRFEAAHAGDTWYGDVMHGPKLTLDGRQCKVYLVALMDDASRLIPHCTFCLGETALDIEGVLKQAILKRGLCHKFIIDNGPAYRAQSLQGICARLQIRLIYCKPYEPEGKAKLERFFRVVRQQFLTELDVARCANLTDLNARLWAWIEGVYHQRSHKGLNGLTPLSRFQQDIAKLRTVEHHVGRLDEIFYHREKRKVNKDGTVAYEGDSFEVPYQLVGQSVILVFDPHRKQPLYVETHEGEYLGAVTPLDRQAKALSQPRSTAKEKTPCTNNTSD
jgi:transposase InsO family protein